MYVKNDKVKAYDFANRVWTRWSKMDGWKLFNSAL